MYVAHVLIVVAFRCKAALGGQRPCTVYDFQNPDKKALPGTSSPANIASTQSGQLYSQQVSGQANLCSLHNLATQLQILLISFETDLLVET